MTIVSPLRDKKMKMTDSEIIDAWTPFKINQREILKRIERKEKVV
jgi:hypothetical protein